MTRKLSHNSPSNLKKFYFGTPYYPEHWDAETREEDAERMANADFNAVRMAEFAWDVMEPREGEFDFALFDETIARMGEKEISTILCTPTATPPRWLTYAHPDVLRVNADGVAMQHGSRQHACPSSPVFRAYSRTITQAMADHYAENLHVIGWQTDNELNCHFSECHCENCQVEFREFLREKFDDDIDALNAAWGNGLLGAHVQQLRSNPDAQEWQARLRQSRALCSTTTASFRGTSPVSSANRLRFCGPPIPTGS